MVIFFVDFLSLLSHKSIISPARIYHYAYINHSKNVRNSFLVIEGENIRYCQYVMEMPGSKDCYDYTAWGDSNELLYECTACGIGTNNVKFSYNVQENSHDVEYSYMCAGSSDLFGCVGLRKKQYCIFNKQYDKDTYAELRDKIIAHMDSAPYTDQKGRVYTYGEFFPVELSPFAYNETSAQEYFPLSEEKAAESGFTWRDQKERDYAVTVQSRDLPDHIKDVEDSITSEVIGCAHGSTCNDNCTGAFKITPDELQFYRRAGVPLPRLCPNCRRYERLRQRSRLELYPRTCQCAGAKPKNGDYTNAVDHQHHGSDHCPNEFETTYAPERGEIVYCEACYNAEVV